MSRMERCPDCGNALLSSKTGKPVKLTTHYIYGDCKVHNRRMQRVGLGHLRVVK